MNTIKPVFTLFPFHMPSLMGRTIQARKHQGFHIAPTHYEDEWAAYTKVLIQTKRNDI